MLTRAKKIGGLILRELQNPAVVIALPHDIRAALADLPAELIEMNQRLDRVERRLSLLEQKETVNG
jgi:hypothetical protein